MPELEMDDSIDAIGLHYKRKYEAECQESLTLAMALRDAARKNGDLVAIAENLRKEVARLAGEDGGAAVDGELIPPTKPGGAKAAKAIN